MKNIIILLVFGILLNPLLVKGEEREQKSKKSTEEILFEPMETIITASKREQRIQDSPSTISIITEEDIRESGAMSIPDVLRFVPGIDVMQITSSHWEVNARGLNQIRSNKMLVMIDGRSVYFDYYGGVIWQGLPITIEDISRIEVIRGPISALYGANAFSGIINIITKSPRESTGTNFSFDGGNLNCLRSSFIQGGRNGKLGYKISGSSRNVNSWRDHNNNSERRGITNVKLDYMINGRSSLSFDTGFETGNIEQIILTSILKFDGFTNYAKLNYNYSDLKFQFFWNHGNIKSPSFVNYGDDIETKYNTFDADLFETLNLGSKNTITFGSSFRVNTIESNVIDEDHHQSLLAGFVQNEFRPNKKVITLIGFRIDHHPLVKNNLSPRGSLIFEPFKNHTFRISASKAFRNPSFTDSYLKIPLKPEPLPSPPLPPGSEVNITILGNKKLNPEKIEAYEFGYQTLCKRNAKIKIDLFYNKISEFIGTGNFNPISFIHDPVTGELIIDPNTNLPIPSALVQSFINLGNAKTYGGELDLDFLVNNWFRLRGNYSYSNVENEYTLNHYQMPPKNKFNVISDFSFNNGMSFNLLGRYVDETKWDIDTDNDSIPEEHNIKSYFTFDIRLAYKLPNTQANIILILNNLFNSVHKEYPIGEGIGRRVGIRINVKF